jgi:hypothetical protein
MFPPMSSINQDTIRQALGAVKYPGFSRDIVSFGLLRGLSIEGADIDVQLVLSTNDTAVAARANLSKVEAALMNKIGLDGNPTGNMASFLVVPPDLAYVAAGLMGIAPGQPFQPDARQARILGEGAQLGDLMARTIAYDKRTPGATVYPGKH